MSKHTFRITIVGSKQDAASKANALAALAALDVKTLTALANVVKHDPQKVAMAKQFLGV
ncbi:MAG: hypothetical protein Crog4KO_06750 [Crocinitomicaceae bacterium]